MKTITLALALAVTACSQQPAKDVGNAVPAQPQAPQAPPASEPASPPAPGQPGGLPDDRTPVSEGDIDLKGPQGAAQVVQSYYALIEAKQYAEAYRLWSAGGRSSRMTAEEFAASFGKYREYHAQIGAPGGQEGAAGTSYVEVPVVVYGKAADGSAFSRPGKVVMGRVNDVPGATAEQLQWRIREITLN